MQVIPRVIPVLKFDNETATSSGRGLVHVTTPTDLHWRDVIEVPSTLRYVVAVRYEVSEIYLSVHSFIHSFIHSYSFNVQVDITQLQTDREARKEDRIIYICSS